MAGQLIHIVRAADLLVGALELDGIEIAGTAPNRELRASAGASATRVVLHLPPQHVAEQAFVDHGDETPASIGALEGPVGSRAAGPSRVAFEVPAAELPVACTLPAILELLTRCTPAVVASATRGPDLSGIAGFFAGLLYYFSPPELSAPGPSETAIELPFRLVLSPDEQAGFAHSAAPAAPPGTSRVELWHSRLGLAPGTEGGEADADRRGVRAIWMRRGNGLPWSPTAPKWPHTDDGAHEPFRLNTMSQRDRADIVHVSGNRSYARQAGRDFFASPVAVRRLALSSLGGWLHSRGDWEPPADTTSLLEWTHRATQGRDHFVRIVNAGFLFPFCHLAALVKITERKFVDIAGEPPLLLQRRFIIVRQPVREYAPGAAPPGKWHTMPLRTLQVRTLVTPDLEIPTDTEPDPSHFLITPLGSSDPFRFKLTGTDVEGNALDLSSPLVFILSTKGWDEPTISSAKSMYDAAAGHELDAAGANLALAPGPEGDTTYAAEKLVFTAAPQTPMPSPPPDQDQPGFWPELARASVRAPALQIVAGQDQPATIEYHDTYRSQGLGGVNHGEVIANLAGALALPFGDKGDRSGGLMQPSMDVAGLSRRLGPVGGLGAVDEVALGTFDPKNFFAGAGAKLFGVFTLDQVLARITGANPLDVPRIAAERADDTLSGRIVWKPVPQSYPPTNSIFVVSGATKMEVTATIDPRGAAPRSDVEARIEQFEVHLLPPTGFIEVSFEKLEFTAHAGRKPDVDVVLGEIKFVGPLSFVEELKQLIPLDGFSDPPALEVTPAGIKSSFSLALPDVAVGVFSLENVALGAGFAIPFVGGALTVSFNFCKREEPFLLTVSLFGGGGFFGLSIDPNGVQMLEAALEFGANCAINLGVAQGGVHVMAGIYFKIESGKGCTLTGYFRLGGNMSVLGLISASIELNLSFTYEEATGKAVGRATLTVEIDIFMFSISVEVSCERKFAGNANDPDFRALMGPYEDEDGVTRHPWRTYCKAYA